MMVTAECARNGMMIAIEAGSSSRPQRGGLFLAEIRPLFSMSCKHWVPMTPTWKPAPRSAPWGLQLPIELPSFPSGMHR